MEPNPTKQPVRVLYQGQEYIVKYRHDQTMNELKGTYSTLLINGTTVAFLGDYDNPIDDITATAYCSAKDTFNKRTGRIVSTVRLIKKLNENEQNIINEGL